MEPFVIASLAVVLVVGFLAGRLAGSRRAGPRVDDTQRLEAERLRAEAERLRGEADHGERELEAFADEVAHGRLPDATGAGLGRLRAGLEAGWTPRNEEREEALRQALGRIAAFLQESVQQPLLEVRDGDRQLLQEGVDRALGGIRDLEFFLREPLTPDETHDLASLVQQVVRDFIADWEVAVRFAAPGTPVRAHIHRDTFLDAIYLLLHNAGHFSDWQTLDVQVGRDDERVQVLIRDRGPGFSDEALDKARDLFYTTKPAGLGLGIPFARRIIEGFGGQLELRNRTDATGAEVVLTLPGE